MISACIITRDEADLLDRCLKSLAKYPLEIVVVDTGSADNSVEIAHRYTDKVFSFKWCRDFSAARNYAAQKASNDYILMVDTDEVLVWADFDKLITNPEQTGAFERVNIFTRSGEKQVITEYISRLYDRRIFTYEGKIHEQLVKKDGSSYKIYEIPLRFEHSGYDGSADKVSRKADRNIELLLEEYNSNPHDTYILYQLGKACYMKRDYENAFFYFDKATYEDVDERLEYVVDLIVSYGYSMINTGRANMALGLEGLEAQFGKRAEFLFMMGLVYMNNTMFEQAVDSFLKATKIPECSVMGANSYMAFYNAGVVKECLGYIDEAKAFYRKCGNYDKAVKRLEMLEA